MNDMTVPSTEQILSRLAEALGGFPPEQKKAATWILENPHEIGVGTVREVAEGAEVKPNTLVRMAREIGLDGYDAFREPFREALRRPQRTFPDRARWLQSIAAEGALGRLYADMAGAAIRNVEETFAATEPEAMKAAAETIWGARRVFTLGVGVNHSNAQNFTYLASTGMVDFHSLPRPGGDAVDALAFADGRDVLIAITCKPYRREVVEAVEAARRQGLKTVGISDSPASPLIVGADHGFVVSCDTPQFFPSSVSTIALLETLLSFVIASASPEIVQRVEKFHARRHALGLYMEDADG